MIATASSTLGGKFVIIISELLTIVCFRIVSTPEQRCDDLKGQTPWIAAAKYGWPVIELNAVPNALTSIDSCGATANCYHNIPMASPIA